MGSIYDELWRRRRSSKTDTISSEPITPPLHRYHTNEMSFDRPVELKDKSLHMLTLNENGPSPFSLMITRGTIEETETLNEAASRVVGECEKVMHDAVLVEPITSCQIDELDSVRVEYRWRQHGMLLHQQHHMVIRRDEYGQHHLIQFTATSNSPTGFSQQNRELLASFLASIQWRQVDRDVAE